MRLTYDHPAWLYVWGFLGILALPLLVVILVVALFYEVTTRVDRRRRLAEPVHWAAAVGFALLVMVGLYIALVRS